MTIGHVSDTARWVAVYRAMESERSDAIFRDPFARRLAGPEGERIVSEMSRGRAMAWAMIVRTAVFDELIRDAVASGEVDTVINLAAGLDARPWRMELPASLRWVDVDLPGILDYKLGILENEETVCDYRAIRADLTDADARRQALRSATDGSTGALVVTEGLLIYLTADSVAALSKDLAGTPVRSWIMDLASPRLLKWMRRKWGRETDQGNASFRFAPAEGTAFFEPFGWKEVSFRPSGDDARRLGREMRGIWFWRLITRLMPKAKQEEFKRMAGVAVLSRTGG